MEYALIKNNTVTNIIIADYTSAQMIAQQDGFDAAINCDRYPIKIGDLYEDGQFMNAEDIRDDLGNLLIPARTVIERELSGEEIIAILKADNASLKEENTQLKQDLLDTQMTLDFVLVNLPMA